MVKIEERLATGTALCQNLLPASRLCPLVLGETPTVLLSSSLGENPALQACSPLGLRAFFAFYFQKVIARTR